MGKPHGKRFEKRLREKRRECGWCGESYVRGYWPWHAAWGHRYGPYTVHPAALDRWMQANGLVMP